VVLSLEIEEGKNPFGELFLSELGRGQRDLIGTNNERPSSRVQRVLYETTAGERE
jgi:hypothetical protein